MSAAEQLAAYRSRHVIQPVVDAGTELVCKTCRIRVFERASGAKPKLYRHDPDEIKRLVKVAAEEPAAKPQVTALDMAVDHLKELGAHEFEGRSDRGCTRCTRPDRSVWHLRGYAQLADLVNAGTIKRRTT